MGETCKVGRPKLYKQRHTCGRTGNACETICEKRRRFAEKGQKSAVVRLTSSILGQGVLSPVSSMGFLASDSTSQVLGSGNAKFGEQCSSYGFRSEKIEFMLGC